MHGDAALLHSFARVQGDAEAALERLSDTLEKDLTRYYSREEFWREKQQLRNQVRTLCVAAC